MSFVKTSAFRGLNSDSDDIKIDSSGNISLLKSNIVNKNLFINGGMNVWQYSTSVSVNNDTGKPRSVDRWTNSVNQGTWTFARSTDVPASQGFSYSLSMSCTAADASPAAGDYLIVGQKMEGQNLIHLLKGTSEAKSVTLSFWIKSNKTGTAIAEFFDNNNTRHINKSFTIDTANTWEKKEITYEGDTVDAFTNDNGHAARIQLWFGAGSNYTSGTLQTSWDEQDNTGRAVGISNWADSTSNVIYLTGCQLEIGDDASTFEFEPYDTIERKCMRYFYAFSMSVRFFRADERAANGQMFSETRIHPVPMRANPLLTYSGTPSLHKHWIRIETGYSGWGQVLSSRSTQEYIYPGTNDQDCQMMSFEGITRKYDAELL